MKGKAHNENEEQAAGITNQDVHFPVASQAQQSPGVRLNRVL